MQNTTIANLWLAILCLPIFGLSQNIPASPNAYDEAGHKHGRWTYIYSPSWQVTEDPDSISYYRLITYEHGQPKGIVRDYYSNGNDLWNGKIQILHSKEILDSICTWHYPNGEKEYRATYVSGILHGKFEHWNENRQLVRTGQYQNDEQVGVWTYWDQHGKIKEKKNFSTGEGLSSDELYQKMSIPLLHKDYESALEWSIKALNQVEIEFGKQHLNYALGLDILGHLNSNLNFFNKAEHLYQQSLQNL